MKSKHLVLLSLLLSLGTVPVFGMEQKTKSKGKEKDTELTVMQKSMATLPPEMKGEVLYHFYNKNTNTPFDPLNCLKLTELLPPKLTDNILDKVAWPITGLFYKRISNDKEWNWEGRINRLPADLKKRVTRNLQLMAGPKKTREYKCPDSLMLMYGQTSLGVINNKVLGFTQTKNGFTPSISVWNEQTGNFLYNIHAGIWPSLTCKDKLIIRKITRKEIKIYSLEQERPVLFDKISVNTDIQRVIKNEDFLLIGTSSHKIYHYNIDTKELKTCSIKYDSFRLPKRLPYFKGHLFFAKDKTTMIDWDIKNNLVTQIKTREKITDFGVSNSHLILKFLKSTQITDINSGKTHTINYWNQTNKHVKSFDLRNNHLIVEHYSVSPDVTNIDIIDLKHKRTLTLNNCCLHEIIKNGLVYRDNKAEIYKVINLNTNKTKTLNSLEPHIFDNFIVTFYIDLQCELDIYNLNGSFLYTVPVNEGGITINNQHIDSKAYLLGAAAHLGKLLKYDFPATLEEAVKTIRERSKTEK